MRFTVSIFILLTTFSSLSKDLNFSVTQKVHLASNYCFKYFDLNRVSLNDFFKNEKGINYQLNSWKYRSDELIKKAEKLENSVEDILLYGKINSDELIGIGSSGARLVKLNNEIQGVFKIGDSWASDIGSEVASYRLDRMLNLNIVPVTVKRSINDELGSLQFFVRDAKMAKEVDPRIIQKSDKAKLEILDYLIQNSDRNTSNYLITDQGKIVAIDHGLAFSNSDLFFKVLETPKFSNTVIEFLKTKKGEELISLLRSISDKDIKRELKGVLKKKMIKELNIRKNHLVKLAR